MNPVKKLNNNPVAVSVGKNKQPSFIGSYLMQDVSVCDNLISFMDRGPQREGAVISSKGLEVNSKVKDCVENMSDYSNPACLAYQVELQKNLEQYKLDYFYANDVSHYNIENWTIQKYPCGGAYHSWHTERTNLNTIRRHLVFMTYLNDIKDGGETEFFYQKLKVKPRKGLTLIWPVDWTHTHRGVPSMTEEKYIVTGWDQFVEHIENGN